MVIFMKGNILKLNKKIKKYCSITKRESKKTEKIDVSSIEVTKILDSDYKYLVKYKKDLDYILDQLNKSINQDINKLGSGKK